MHIYLIYLNVNKHLGVHCLTSSCSQLGPDNAGIFFKAPGGNENFLRILYIGNFFFRELLLILCCISVLEYCQLVVMCNVIIIHVSSPARKELWRTIFRRL